MDKMSSAHVYLRVKRGETWDDIRRRSWRTARSSSRRTASSATRRTTSALHMLVKPHRSLSMEEGLSGISRPKLVPWAEKKKNEIVNLLNKTKRKSLDLARARRARIRRSEKKAHFRGGGQKARGGAPGRQRGEEPRQIMDTDNKVSNKDNRTMSFEEAEDDFMWSRGRWSVSFSIRFF